MEKLYKLLNEFIKEKNILIIGGSINNLDMDYFITKKAKFIQRLVENDKIDFDKCGRCYEINSTYDHYNLEDRQDLWLLMLLAISDTPIEDLISYLKE